MTFKRIFIASGGTGGHLLPAQILAEELIHRGCDVSFCGKGLDRFLTPDTYQTFEIHSAPLFQKNPIKMLKSIGSLWIGFCESLVHIYRKQPEVVVGFGSYHSFPVLLAAYLLRKPIVLLESNCVLGRVNRFFAKKSRALAIQFPLSSTYKNAVFVPQLPWTSHMVRKKCYHNLDPHVFTFMIFGGSQGASFLNQLFLKTIPLMKERFFTFQVVHLTGNAQVSKEAKEIYDALGIMHYTREFEKQIADLYTQADLVICRAGANTVGELIQAEKPAFLIPYPFATDQHQTINAEFFQTVVKGGCFCEQKYLTPELFLLSLQELIQKVSLEKFSENIRCYKQKEMLKPKKKLSEIILDL